MSDFNPIKRERHIRESNIEEAFRRRVQDLGGLALKFTSPARRSVPDRLVLMPGGLAGFCELKAPGQRPTASQVREHERLRALGFRVDVIDNLEDARAWMPAVFYADIGRILGVLMDPRFIEHTLGVPPRSDTHVAYWDESDLPLIIIKLVQHMFNLGQVKEILGVGVTEDFIADKLGIEPAKRDKRSVIYSDEQIQQMFSALEMHFRHRCGQPITAPAAKPVKSTKKEAADPLGLGISFEDKGGLFA